MGKEPSNKNLLDVCQMAYRKHVLDDDGVGWDELSEALAAVLSSEMGDKEFINWLDSVSTRTTRITE